MTKKYWWQSEVEKPVITKEQRTAILNHFETLINRRAELDAREAEFTFKSPKAVCWRCGEEKALTINESCEECFGKSVKEIRDLREDREKLDKLTGIQRFTKFLEEIASTDKWEYEDGVPMRQDAADFLEWVNSLEYADRDDDWW